MKKLIYSLTASSLFFILFACGGGGGSSGGVSSGVLSQTVQGVSTSTMTIGNAVNASGGVVLVWKQIRQFFANLENPLLKSAYAQSISSCGSATNAQLIGTQDSVKWSLMNLTTSTASSGGTAGCVIGFQDAGNYMVLATSGVTDTSGNNCDLVTIAKSTGTTACFTLDLSDRASTGNPLFLLGAYGFKWSRAQLTKNGNYFFIPFYTQRTNAAYVGFYRFDFTSSTPIGKIGYAEYGTQVSNCDGSPTVNNNNLLWTMGYWILENGNFTFDQFNVTACNDSLPNYAAGTSKYYYVDVNNTIDPLNAQKYLFDQHIVPTSYSGPDARGPYMIDNTNSPLGQWIQSSLIAGTPEYVNWQNATGNVWDFGGEVLSSASTSASDLSFYIVIGNSNGSMPNSCSKNGTMVYGVNSGINGNELIKVSIINGSVTYQDLGTTNIGSGWGSLPATDNIYASPDGFSLVSLHWTSNANNLYVTKISRQMSASACDVYTQVAPSVSVPVPDHVSNNISQVANGGFIANQLPFTYRAKDYVYLASFGSESWELNCSSTENGCQIPSDAQIWAYDKNTDSVSIVPIGQLTAATYFSTGTNANGLSNTLSSTLVDANGNKFWYSLTPTGVGHMVQLHSGFNPSNALVMGAN
jgi:hypothetical protein